MMPETQSNHLLVYSFGKAEERYDIGITCLKCKASARSHGAAEFTADHAGWLITQFLSMTRIPCGGGPSG